MQLSDGLVMMPIAFIQMGHCQLPGMNQMLLSLSARRFWDHILWCQGLFCVDLSLHVHVHMGSLPSPAFFLSIDVNASASVVCLCLPYVGSVNKICG